MNSRERELVNAAAQALSSLGMATGYLNCGEPLTRRLQRAVGAYGVEPNYHTFGHKLDPLLQASEARGSSTPSPSEDDGQPWKGMITHWEQPRTSQEGKMVISGRPRSPSEDELREVLAQAYANYGDDTTAEVIRKGGFTDKWPPIAAMRTILHRTHTSGETELEAAGSGVGLR